MLLIVFKLLLLFYLWVFQSGKTLENFDKPKTNSEKDVILSLNAIIVLLNILGRFVGMLVAIACYSALASKIP